MQKKTQQQQQKKKPTNSEMQHLNYKTIYFMG